MKTAEARTVQVEKREVKSLNRQRIFLEFVWATVFHFSKFGSQNVLEGFSYY